MPSLNARARSRAAELQQARPGHHTRRMVLRHEVTLVQASRCGALSSHRGSTLTREGLAFEQEPPHAHGPTVTRVSACLQITSSMSVTATIKWFDRKKGYGFATPEGGGEDIFVHALNIAKDEDNKQPFIDDGDTIYYDVGEHNGRPTAINVAFPPDR